MWLWGQTLAAIGDAVARDVRDHWLLALRAIGVGSALLIAWDWGMNRLSSLLSRGGLLGETGGPFLMSGNRFRIYQTLLLFTFMLRPVVVGWIVARTHRAQQGTMVLAFAAAFVLPNAWHLTVHYSQMESSCVHCMPDIWLTNLAIDCVQLLGILIGGLLVRPSKRLA